MDMRKLRECATKEVPKYGVIAPDGKVRDNLYNVRNFVEKPAIDKAPSDLAIIGRCLLTPEIFDILAETKPGRDGEVQLIDAIDTLNKTPRKGICLCVQREVPRCW